MKKILGFVAVLFVVGAMNASALGIGVQGNFGWSQIAGYGGSLLISPTEKLHFAVGADLWDGGLGIGVTADFWIINPNITGVLDWYFGVGPYGNLFLGDSIGIGAGVRVPVGLDLKFDRVDIFLQFAPGINVIDVPSGRILGILGFWFHGVGNLGIRFWL
jgi:hypothetical protein